jgi:hypothetical protein
MALFGRERDIFAFNTFNRELLEDIISQQIGYYKVKLNETSPNIYGEAMNKYYIGPVLLNCLIERGDYSSNRIDYTLEVNRVSTFRFFKNHLIDAHVVPEVGDVVMWNENYYEVDNVNENQLIVGKDNQYAYSDGLQYYGNSLSIILTTHYVSPDKLGINENRL